MHYLPTSQVKTLFNSSVKLCMRKFVVIWKGSSQKLPQVPAMFVFFLEGLNYLKTF